MAHNAFETLLRTQKGRSYPSQHHLAILPMGNAASLDTHSGVRALDDVDNVGYFSHI